MYRTCIFCSADLGINESFEHFPVGRRVAIDASRGRLWAICEKCGRWNLAPIEERWEAVEDAEGQFRDSRLRVQTENIGMARLADGTQLVRIGEALQGELAAWRYGVKFMQRRRKSMLVIGGAVVGGAALLAGMPLLHASAFGGMISPVLNLGNILGQRYAKERVVHRLDEGGGTPPVIFRQRHFVNSALILHEGQIAVSLPHPGQETPWYELELGGSKTTERIILSGTEARTIASRAMLRYNDGGGSKKNIASAVDVLQDAGNPDDFIARVAATGLPLMKGEKLKGSLIDSRVRWHPSMGPKSWNTFSEKLTAPYSLALEMALHEESERRAMEGELAELEDAWREAEEIARIADALPEEPPE